MIHFDNDYTEGAHEKILDRFLETNMVQAPGYGTDKYSEQAKNYIKKLTENENVDVHFLSGGTQTNLIVIAASLQPYQGVITAETGHIHTLETGSIEAVGHKILLLPSADGKIYSNQIEKMCQDYWSDRGNVHKVQPGMVYISNPTELGTLYSKNELKQISEVCKEYNLKLFVDGARMGYGLTAETNDLTLKDFAEFCDVFYIGGTKIGALFGEAVVIKDKDIKNGFRAITKQKGGLLAKGRALGIQFEVLFEDNLYFEISEYAVKQAMRIKSALNEKNIPLKYEAYSNQLFPIFSEANYNKIKEKYILTEMQKEDKNHQLVRICTSWGTNTTNVDQFVADILKLDKQ